MTTNLFSASLLALRMEAFEQAWELLKFQPPDPHGALRASMASGSYHGIAGSLHPERTAGKSPEEMMRLHHGNIQLTAHASGLDPDSMWMARQAARDWHDGEFPEAEGYPGWMAPR